MSASPTTKLIERLTANRLLSSSLSLATLIAGIATVSLPLLLVSGLLAYGWPFLHVYLANVNDAANSADKPARASLTTLRTSALAAH